MNQQDDRDPHSSSNNRDTDDIIDLKEYFRTINRYKWGILGLALAASILSALISYSLTPIYRATATLFIESDDVSVLSIEEIYGLASATDEYYLTQYEILKSSTLAERVIDNLDLLEHSEFKASEEESFNWRTLFPFSIIFDESGPVSDYVTKRRIINQFIGQLYIEPILGTQLVQISFESTDRQLSAAVANELAQVYIDASLEGKLEVTLQASNWLNNQLGSLQLDLQQAEQRLQSYRELEQIVGSDGGMDLANRELDLISERLLEARRERLEIESAIEQLDRLGSDDLDALQRIPVVLNHSLVAQYFQSARDAELRVSEFSKRYGHKHPTMISAQNELENSQEQLQRQVSAVVGGIQTDYQIAVANEQAVSDQLDLVKGNVQDLSRKEFELRALENDVQTKQQIYDTFFTRSSETSATADFSSANARVSDPAVVPLGSVKPRKTLIVMITFVLTIMSGMALAILANILDNTIKLPEDISDKLGTNLLGILPLLLGTKKKQVEKLSYSHFLEEPKSNFSEAVRTIRTSLMLTNLDNPPKFIGITSTVPSEGKTSNSLAMAYSLAQLENVLLIDLDMRRPSIGKALEIDKSRPGIANVVAGVAELDQAILRYEDGNLDIITAGTIPPNPLELISSKRFSETLLELGKRYDRIIIDTAPCGAVSDALALAPLLDGIVYVVKADSTPANQVISAVNRIREASNTPLLGVVLNQVDLRKKNTYYGEYYSGYYNYSSYGTEG